MGKWTRMTSRMALVTPLVPICSLPYNQELVVESCIDCRSMRKMTVDFLQSHWTHTTRQEARAPILVAQEQTTLIRLCILMQFKKQ